MRPRGPLDLTTHFDRGVTEIESLQDLFARGDFVGTSQHFLGGGSCRAVLDFERQSVPRSRDVDKNGSHPGGLRAISHLPTFGGKLSTFSCVNHPRPPDRAQILRSRTFPLSVCNPTCRTNFGCLWCFRQGCTLRRPCGTLRHPHKPKSRGLDRDGEDAVWHQSRLDRQPS